MDKRGQSMSINTVIILILAVVVLVILILGFTIGWNKLAPWASNSNVANIVSSCESACFTNSAYEYCTTGRLLRGEDKVKITTSCYVFSRMPEFEKYKINECDSIECTPSCSEIDINGLSGKINFDGEGYEVSSIVAGLSSGEVCKVPFK